MKKLIDADNPYDNEKCVWLFYEGKECEGCPDYPCNDLKAIRKGKIPHGDVESNEVSGKS